MGIHHFVMPRTAPIYIGGGRYIFVPFLIPPGGAWHMRRIDFRCSRSSKREKATAAKIRPLPRSPGCCRLSSRCLPPPSRRFAQLTLVDETTLTCQLRGRLLSFLLCAAATSSPPFQLSVSIFTAVPGIIPRRQSSAERWWPQSNWWALYWTTAVS